MSAATLDLLLQHTAERVCGSTIAVATMDEGLHQTSSQMGGMSEQQMQQAGSFLSACSLQVALTAP